MKVLLTGATGFIGAALVPELINFGHKVVGLTRSNKGEQALIRAEAQVLRGDVNQSDDLRKGAENCDGIIHAAFSRDFNNMKESSEDDRKVITTLGEIISGSERPLIVTSGTGLVRSKNNKPVEETDDHVSSKEFPRAASEEAADALTAQGLNVRIMRLAQVHDTHKQGRISQHILLAKQKGYVAYIGGGTNSLPAVHVSDAARLFRLVLEKGEAGRRYHAVAEESIPIKEVLAVIAEGMKLPLVSISKDEAKAYFGPLAGLAVAELAATADWTRQQMNWQPSGAGLLADLGQMDYMEVKI